jgi:hypothetical protein
LTAPLRETIHKLSDISTFDDAGKNSEFFNSHDRGFRIPLCLALALVHIIVENTFHVQKYENPDTPKGLKRRWFEEDIGLRLLGPLLEHLTNPPFVRWLKPFWS